MYWLGNFIQPVDLSYNQAGKYHLVTIYNVDHRISFAIPLRSAILKFYKNCCKTFCIIDGRFKLTLVRWYDECLEFDNISTKYIVKKPESWNNLKYKYSLDTGKTTVTTHLII